MAEPLTLTAYAARRGVSKMAVSRAVKSGRLSKSVSRDAAGRPSISDPDLADREWAASTDLSKAPGYVKERAEGKAVPLGRDPSRGGRPPVVKPEPEGDGLSLTEQSAREKFWKANHAEIEYRERVGELVDAKQVQDQIADAFTRVRARLLGLPTRIRQQIPHLSVDDVTLVDGFVREALEDLVLEFEEPEAADAA